MSTSTVPKMDTNAILEKVVPVAQMVMDETMKAGGMGFTSSIRESEAAAKYLRASMTTYKGNPIVEGVINSLGHMRGEHKEKIDIGKLDSTAVLNKVAEIDPLLDAEGEQGLQTKQFIYGLAESIAGASGKSMFSKEQKVSPEETKFLADLKAKLNMEKAEQPQVQQQPVPATPAPVPAPQAPATAAQPAQSTDVTAELQKLAQLHQTGVLSDQEFAEAKQKLLSK